MKSFLTFALALTLAAVGCKPQSKPTDEPTPVPPAPGPAVRPTPPPPPLPQTKLTPPPETPTTAPAAKQSGTELLQKYQTLWSDADGRESLIQDLTAGDNGLSKTEVARTLGQMLKIETDANVKVSLLEELGSVEDVSALDTILAALDANQPAEVREAAADAADSLFSDLAFAGDKSVLNHLTRALDPRYPTAVRESAISAMEDLDDPKAIPHLQKLLNDRDPQIKEAAQTAIDWLTPE